MSQHNSQYSKTQSKNSSSNLTKTVIIAWIYSIVKDYSHQIIIELLGDGEIYCCIINHYVPGTISPNRIIFNPKNQYEYSINLKQFQNALLKLKININFDIQKVCKQKFNQNWVLITQLYKHLEVQDNKKSDAGSKKQSIQDFNVFKSIQSSSKINNIVEVIPQKAVGKVEKVALFDNFPKGSLLFAVDNVKSILLSNTHDTEKIRQIKHLFGLEEIKFEDSELNYNNSIRFID